MIARHEATADRVDVWALIAAPLPADAIEWRQDGRATERGGKFFARFVAYVSAQFVRERLDAVCPGEWDLTLTQLPTTNDDGDSSEKEFAFLARLQILGVTREDVGTGRDYKTASTDAFKRAAVRFGVAAELYDYGQNWVQVESDGKFAKPVEDPGAAYDRRRNRSATRDGGGAKAPLRDATPSAGASTSAPPAPNTSQLGETDEKCPKCRGAMWDNRRSKTNPKAPDFKCQNRKCDGVIWPERVAAAMSRTENDYPAALEDDQDDLPF